MGQFYLKTRIIFGEKSCHDYDYSLYSRVLFVTDNIIMKVGLPDLIISRLNEQKIEYRIFDSVEPNPSFETVTKGVIDLLEFKPDAIIALGGGSVIDASKGFIYYADQFCKENKKDFSKPLLIAIPTTSGAGSEVTSYTVITDTKSKTKIAISSEYIIPDIAILDPLMTKTSPPKVTAESGIDVLTHVLESYVAINASDCMEALAEKACDIVFDKLITVFNNPDDLKARLAMHEASCMAGMAFTNSGLGLNHAMSHSLGGLFHIPHGRANALLMPYVINYNKKVVAHKYAKLSFLLGLPSSNVEEGVSSLLIAIESLCNKINIERTVTDFGINKEDYLKAIPEMAKAAYNDACLDTNPIQPTIEDIEEIYRKLV